LNADGLHAVLSFLNSDSDTEVVATPRAVTLDNQTARLEVTRAFPIFKTTPGTSQTPAGSEITYTNLGTILTVTPRISANSNIALKVVPEVSNIDSVDKQVSNGQAQTANVYAIRRIETQVVIPSGHTLVMGGLISDSSSKIQTKIPILGDLPLVGLAFRHDNKSRLKSNLLIFITPTIVNDEDFQAAPTQFLKTKIVVKADKEESAWDSGKPYDWTKPVE
jgi:general secretion pathway protein D